MALESGKYSILYDADGDQRQVFRGAIEDRSFGPKAIYAYHRGRKAPQPWELEKTGSRSIDLKALGAPTGVWEDKGPLAFLLQDQADSYGWKLERARGLDDRRYIITTNNGELAWTVTEGAGNPNGDLIVLRPKDGSARQVFIFVRESGGDDDYLYGDDEYFPSGASQKHGRERKEQAPQLSRFGYKRRGRGQNFCQ
ncbi:hypothetical protein TWF481_000699 [Arthrobotrys musiformis]|uniref:Ricin B lectin domain-containing protein n=1 Tax=Arthrobotrys musiformis TaxID=47236 RepID=A0AAV9WNN1_9PEZI